jgi:3-oxoacyl-[acyl-carrier protein] reductase
MKAMVTGAGRGIGRAVALELAHGGWDVAIQVHASVAAGEAVRLDIDGLGRRSLIVVADYADKAQAVRSAREVMEAWGTLDALVLNAGISSPHGVFDMDEADIDRVIDTNLKAPLLVGREVMRAMRESGRGGAIVIIGSAAGHTGGALVGPHYAASKAGTHAMVKSLAKAGAPFGIRVNGIAPGFVDTDGLDRMIEAHGIEPAKAVPLGRVGRPEEIARCASFLLGDSASYVTGAMLDVNGGLVMR